jgi:predicted deacetylase
LGFICYCRKYVFKKTYQEGKIQTLLDTKKSNIKNNEKMIMSKAKFLIRLDDACETQDEAKWTAIESLLEGLKIKPIVAVIPSNSDISLHFNKKNTNFWEKVKDWEKKGWTIAQHGYQHTYHDIKKELLILPFHNRSEFAGLDFQQQADLIEKGYAKFISHGIKPKVWIAPSHAFDKNTLEALKNITPIRVISDGIACHPFPQEDLMFIPQQLWWPKWRPFGVWTVCLHPNSMSFEEIASLEQILCSRYFSENMISIHDALQEKKSFRFLFNHL